MIKQPFVFILWMAFAAACGNRAKAPPAAQTGTWSTAVITKYLAEGDCEKSLAYLQQQPESLRTPEWYDYLSQSHLVCGEKDASGTEDQKAVDAIDAGLRRYPGSPRLLKSKAERVESLGRTDDAARLYQSARAAAQRRVDDGVATVDDRMVLAEIDQQKMRRPLPPPGSSVPKVPLDTTSQWANEIPTLLSRGDCKAAIDRLNTIRERNALWYELSAESDAVCFRQTKQRSYADGAVSNVNDGISRYPSSVRLRLTKAIVSEMLGNSAAADDAYRDTEELAKRVLAQKAGSPEADEARRIIEAIAMRNRNATAQ